LGRSGGFLLVSSTPNYDGEYLANLFDRMGPTYDIVNVVTSFGFCNIWRRQCVAGACVLPGSAVADLMAGSGECWPYVLSRIGPSGKIHSVDFSNVMSDRQRKRRTKHGLSQVEVRHENALAMALPDASMDAVISAFGLKTFNEPQWQALSVEIGRILKPGGSLSLLEISMPRAGAFQWAFEFYIERLIPILGRMFLGEIDCYRMLGVYTKAFGSCERVLGPFREAGLIVEMRSHFYGCATSVVGTKPM